MGVDVHTVHFLSYCADRAPFGKTVTIGRQELTVPQFLLQRILGVKLNFQLDGFVEGLFLQAFVATEVESMDASLYEGATFSHDLNHPVPPSFHRRYETLFDGGSSEHIFDIAQVLSNYRTMVKSGGQIIHVLPANNQCGHGFWQFSPELFFSLYSKKNGFCETEVFVAEVHDTRKMFRVSPPSDGSRMVVNSTTPVILMVRTVIESGIQEKFAVQQSDYVPIWDNPSPSSGNSEGATGLLFPGLSKRLRKSPNLYRLVWPFWDLLRPLHSRMRTLFPKRKFGISARNPNLTEIRWEELTKTTLPTK